MISFPFFIFPSELSPFSFFIFSVKQSKGVTRDHTRTCILTHASITMYDNAHTHIYMCECTLTHTYSAHIYLYIWHIYTMHTLTHVHSYTRKVVIAIIGRMILVILREIHSIIDTCILTHTFITMYGNTCTHTNMRECT